MPGNPTASTSRSRASPRRAVARPRIRGGLLERTLRLARTRDDRLHRFHALSAHLLAGRALLALRTQGVARIQKRLYDSHFDRLNAMKVGYRLFPPAVSYADGRLTVQAPADEEVFCVEEPSGEEFPLHRTGLHDLPGALPVPHPARHGPQSVGRRPGLLPHHYARRPLQQLLQREHPGPLRTAGAVPGAAWTTRTCRRGDWMLFTFEQPVRCREIHLQTGFFPPAEGHSELRNGRNILRRRDLSAGGELTAGACRLHPDRPVRAIRVTSGCDGNGDPRVIIQPLRIKP